MFACGAPPRPVDREGRAVTPRATIVHFWATWCVPCRAELPQLATYARTHRMSLVTIARDRNFEEVDRFLRTNAIEVDVLLDADGSYGRAMHADKLPTTLVYDRGVVRDRYEGAREWR